MTSKFLLRFGFLVLPVFLGACTKDEDTDYCQNHYRFHDQHLESVAMLNIELNSEGILDSELRLPNRILPDPGSAALLLERPASVYSLQTTTDCESPSTEALLADGSTGARYRSDCGIDNRLEQVDVVLFESLPALDEIVVNVITPATAKRFAISRQCERAIFRLETKLKD